MAVGNLFEENITPPEQENKKVRHSINEANDNTLNSHMCEKGQVPLNLQFRDRTADLWREVLHPDTLRLVRAVAEEQVGRMDHDPHAARVLHQEGLSMSQLMYTATGRHLPVVHEHARCSSKARTGGHAPLSLHTAWIDHSTLGTRQEEAQYRRGGGGGFRDPAHLCVVCTEGWEIRSIDDPVAADCSLTHSLDTANTNKIGRQTMSKSLQKGAQCLRSTGAVLKELIADTCRGTNKLCSHIWRDTGTSCHTLQLTRHHLALHREAGHARCPPSLTAGPDVRHTHATRKVE